MPKLKDREQVFLWILQEDSNRDEINKKTEHFKDSDCKIDYSDYIIDEKNLCNLL